MEVHGKDVLVDFAELQQDEILVQLVDKLEVFHGGFLDPVKEVEYEGLIFGGPFGGLVDELGDSLFVALGEPNDQVLFFLGLPELDQRVLAAHERGVDGHLAGTVESQDVGFLGQTEAYV